MVMVSSIDPIDPKEPGDPVFFDVSQVDLTL